MRLMDAHAVGGSRTAKVRETVADVGVMGVEIEILD